MSRGDLMPVCLLSETMTRAKPEVKQPIIGLKTT
jgi:hypothetical protein